MTSGSSTRMRTPLFAVPIYNKKRASRRKPFNLRGAAYRIRTYDVLIRSQTLYPAEVTPPVQEPLSGLPDNLVRRIGFEPMTF